MHKTNVLNTFIYDLIAFYCFNLMNFQKQKCEEPSVLVPHRRELSYKPKPSTARHPSPASHSSKPLSYPATRTTQRQAPGLKAAEAPSFVHKQNLKVDPFYNMAPTLLAEAGIIQSGMCRGTEICMLIISNLHVPL